MPLSTTGYYLQRFGMTAQRPVKRNPKQNSALVRKWVEEEFPVIKARCEEENGIIFWGDETGIQNESNYIKGYTKFAFNSIANAGVQIRLFFIGRILFFGAAEFSTTDSDIA
ncbi:hypothetical protein FACS1894120_5920 [Clostridia bacterium]|nr:hypothetical protein FACS1894120_5920 [Clostridia bacterium]